MKQGLLITFFTFFVTFLYWCVGQSVEQKEIHPAKDVQLGADMTTEQMAEAGKKIVEGKGTCLICHGSGERAPKLIGVGERAGGRIEGYSDLDYFAESLYEPEKYIVKPYAPGMTPVNKPPIALNDQEILTVIAYLQSLGGKPNVTMKTKLKYQSAEGSAAPKTQEAAAEELTGQQLATNYGCVACHSLTAPVRLVGPSLYDAGKRLSKAEIYESIMDPDAKLAEGFPGALMGQMLGANGFYNKVTSKQLKVLVEHLASLQGN